MIMQRNSSPSLGSGETTATELYGKVDENGEFNGGNISFIYPDFPTGLTGTLRAGSLISARAVDFVGERCHNEGEGTKS